jgi:hypothetical protein
MFQNPLELKNKSEKRGDHDDVIRGVVAMKQILFVSLIALSTQMLAQKEIPAGTILPVQLNSSLRSDKARAGQRIDGRIMQDVPLPGGRKIHARATVVGHIVSVNERRSGQPAEITLRFDNLEFHHQTIQVSTNLRALASLMEVEDAQVPPTGPDRGTPWVWRTTNLIGGEVAYGEGPVARGTDIVGQALASGVLIRVQPNPTVGCRGEVAGNVEPQALWVFSSDACGLYDLPNLSLKHAGRTDPVGQITLHSNKGNVKVRAGSGMLLRVNGIAPSVERSEHLGCASCTASEKKEIGRA